MQTCRLAEDRSERRPAGRAQPACTRAQHPNLDYRDLSSAEPGSRAIGRILCVAVTGADYALLSPCVRRYGYGAPQRRVGDVRIRV